VSQSTLTTIEDLQSAVDTAPMPDGWRRVRLGDVCNILNGYAFDGVNFSRTEGTPLIRIRDLKTNLPEERYKGSFNPQYLMKQGAILVGMDGEFRCYQWSGQPALLNQRVCQLLPEKEFLDEDFLLLALNDYLNDIELNTAFTTVKHISSKQILAIELTLPPLPEQKRIAAILNEQLAAVDWARTAVEAQVKASKDLPAAYLRETFENSNVQQWQEKRIGDVCAVTKLAGFEYTKYIKYVPDGEYIALRAQNVRNDGLDLRNVVRISREVASVLHRSKLDKDDVVMTFIGANIGEATWVDESDTFYCAPNIAKITPNPEFVDHRFLTLAIQSRPFQKQIQAIYASTAQQSLSMRDIRNFTVPLPSLDEQRQLAAKMLEYRLLAKMLREKLQEQLDAIHPLNATLLWQAFTGKL
jgi:type I restriction enzyme S subunit